MNPAPSTDANPSGVKPKPFIWECGAIREERADDDVGGKGALWAGADVDADADVAFIVAVRVQEGKFWLYLALIPTVFLILQLTMQVCQ